MKKVKGQVYSRVDVECPNCGYSFDAIDDDCDNVIVDTLFDNTTSVAWEDLQINLVCSECDHEFELDSLEY